MTLKSLVYYYDFLDISQSIIYLFLTSFENMHRAICFTCPQNHLYSKKLILKPVIVNKILHLIWESRIKSKFPFNNFTKASPSPVLRVLLCKISWTKSIPKYVFNFYLSGFTCYNSSLSTQLGLKLKEYHQKVWNVDKPCNKLALSASH